MPVLNWIGKEKVVNHHLDVPYRVLEHTYGFKNGNESKQFSGSGNKIIHGDNLEALKALLPEYEGKVKCIYIDPPYNTGNENWVYNDNVNDPKIMKWLGQVVGKESEDLTRHDKWLCMMYPRLKLLHKLLADDGAIFISIDDNEQANLKLMMDEIFGGGNFVGQFYWMKTSTPPSLSKKMRRKLEPLLCYEKKINEFEYNGGFTEGGDMPLLNAGNEKRELNIPRSCVTFTFNGDYKSGKYHNVELVNDIKIKNGIPESDLKIIGEFKWTQDFLNKEIQEGTKIIVKSDKFSLRYIRTGERIKRPSNIISKTECNVGTNEDAKKIISEIFGSSQFDYPKVPSLIEYIIKFQCDENSIILDSFAGSGTTAHAVLNLNKQDGGNRKFILIEMEEYANSITAERVKRVIKGYSDKEGTGGSFDYYELGQPLFNDEGELNELVGVDKLREYIYYTETKEHLVKSKYIDNEYLLDKYNDTVYYFFYEQDSTTTLNYEFLSTIKTKAEQYIVYADNCLLSKEFMIKHHIIFKKIPRDITKF
ncbi:MAG: site-specific DNA-methyltransferase [Bacteroidetes bacterium]|nr:site-specific DNA-methyltransferase [Bacteroidota bacterium]